MTEKLSIINERVDDIPLLLTLMEQMGLQRLLDKHFPAHGNWLGLSKGWVGSIWLSHILSMGDHRLSHVQGWANERLLSLSACTGEKVEALDFADDRLSSIVQDLSDEHRWTGFESDLNRHLIRVYDLGAECVRFDSTTASSYRVGADGLFQFGHSKDYRPDLPQVKVMLATLDPLGMPVATQVVSGNRADDPLYRPSIERVRESLGRSGLLYVGDCKMASLETRGSIAGAGDFYLCPLSETQIPSDELDSLMALSADLTDVHRQEGELIARGFEVERSVSTTVDGVQVSWVERQFVVRSTNHAKAAEAGLEARLSKAQTALDDLNKRGRGRKRYTDRESIEQAAQQIIERFKLQGLFDLTVSEQVETKQIRGYGKTEARAVEDRQVTLSATRNQTAIEAVKQRLGWRVFVTNKPGFSLNEAVLAYRDEFIIERGFARLKGKSLSLTPMYLQRDDHVVGLIRLLSLGLRVLTLMEYVLRSNLGQTQLAGLYAGNPKRATARPTAERLLEAFGNITLTAIELSKQTGHFITPLSPLQETILKLLGFGVNVYARIAEQLDEPPSKMSEP